ARSRSPASTATSLSTNGSRPQSNRSRLLGLSIDRAMDQQLAAAQALKYAEELRELHETERAHRRGVEEALRRLEESYGTTVRALATALELRDDATGEHADRVTRIALRLAERVA